MPTAESKAGKQAGPDRLGRYELRFEIASGGMATLYLARVAGPAGFEKLVALKVIHPHLAGDQNFVDMFLDEARLAARIDHPNVCSVFDFGQEGGTYYMAMEYLFGESLSRVAKALVASDWHAEERIPYVVRMIADAAEGLDAAHELTDADGISMEVVHRDISPQNLFLTYQGSVKVVDFGIARARERLQHTSTGMLKGKLAYMSPEQLEGHEADRRADVWALGVCLWELLTLRRLFRRGSEAATLRAVLDGEIPPPSKVEGVDPRLDPILAKALVRDPAHRYASAAELSVDLRTYLAAREMLVGMPELARFASALMPADLERRTELVAQASRPGESPAAPPPAELTATNPTSSMLREVETLGAVSVPAAQRRSPMMAITASLVLVTAAAFGGGYLLFGHKAEPSTRAVVSDSTPSAPADAAAATPSMPAPVTPADGVADASTGSLPSDAGARGAELVARAVASSTPAVAPLDAGSDAGAGSAARVPRRRWVRRRGPHPPAGMMAEMSPSMSVSTATGRVHVFASGGWANVTVDGRARGRTPAHLRLPVGRHRLGLTPFGQGEPQWRSIEVGAGEEVMLNVRLSAP